MKSKSYNYSYLWLLTLVASMGGFLFGYDWVVVGGAKPFYEPWFNIVDNPSQQGWGTSSAMIGCMIGAFLCFLTTERYGRKWLLAAAGLLFVVSAFGTAWAINFSSYNLWRIVGGISIGITLNLSPVYISEMIPSHLRGRFVSINQLLVNVGILAAQSINLAIASANSIGNNPSTVELRESWLGQIGWRWMFAAEAIPAIMFFVLMIIIPESVRWLVKNRQENRALTILNKIGGSQYAQSELSEIHTTVSSDSSGMNFRALFEPKMLKILGIGFFIAILQQWCGLNVIFYYAADIFKQAGYGINGMMFNIVIIGSIAMIGVVVAILMVDKVGRRKLMLWGTASIAVIYGIIGLLFYFNISGLPVVIFVLLNVLAYQLTLSPIVWVILSEIFPNRVRGAAMSLSALILWAGCFSLTYSFPLIKDSLGWANNFWLYGAICFVSFFILYYILPETKNKTLEQIEKELTQ
ncbi:MAG: sugar porter family MFS transporter [Prevotellaceae bacterium]|jgi:SP family sugar porter-like MFS transporter|nr:sugar porter family MFS transporter [Prevotellaceae bacterium]